MSTGPQLDALVDALASAIARADKAERERDDLRAQLLRSGATSSELARMEALLDLGTDADPMPAPDDFPHRLCHELAHEATEAPGQHATTIGRVLAAVRRAAR